MGWCRRRRWRATIRGSLLSVLRRAPSSPGGLVLDAESGTFSSGELSFSDGRIDGAGLTRTRSGTSLPPRTWPAWLSPASPRFATPATPTRA